MEQFGVAEDAWRGLGEVEPLVRGWVGRRCARPCDVDDVVQDTLLRAARYRGGLGSPERLAGWALSIAANSLRDHMRRRLERCAAGDQGFEFDELACDGRVAESCPSESLLRIGGRRVSSSEALEHLRAAFRVLRREDVTLLLEHYGGERTAPLTPALRCRLYRARRRLARELELRIGLDRRAPASAS